MSVDSQASNPVASQGQEDPKKHDITDLNKLYTDADQADQELFAEMRSNLLLIAGEHYAKKGSKFWNRVRDDRQLSNEQKLRLTKNHIQKITKTYVNNILTYSPGVKPTPHDETSLQDQKAAELHDSVWKFAKTKNRLKEKISDWCNDFVGIGETATKIYWDENAGDLKGYEQEVDSDNQPVFTHASGADTPSPTDELGQPNSPKASKRAVFTGDLKFETLYGFNLLRSPNAKSFQDSPYLITRKMVDPDDLKRMVGSDEAKLKLIKESSDQTFIVFDGNSASYKDAKGQVMLRETYFRPCVQYPNGYFYISTSEGILFEGELPFGIFPIVIGHFEKIQTTPRGRSIVKVLRPYQAEINRTASKIAEHQITLGDDKLVMSSGSKIANGGNLPGIRGISVSGPAPTILPGRDGSQFLPYMQAQIEEMYDIAMISEDSEEMPGQLDPYTLLFRSVKQKKRFTRYAERFEQFLVDVCETYLELARNYFPDDMIIRQIGKSEAVNIQEFKSHDKLCYQIKLEPMSDDIETIMGKQLSINHLIQYAGSSLGKEDIGKLARLMPFGNFEQSFQDLTMDYDNGTNMLLALDRGETPQPNQYDNLQYMIKRLTTRIREPDFRILAPPIQQNYQTQLQQYEQLAAQQAQQLQAAEAGFIPTGGYMVVCDLYVDDPQNPNNTRRARLPYEALQWLIKKLETQGQSLQQLENMNQGALADMASQMTSRNNQMAPQAQGQGAGAMRAGQARPGAVPHGSASQSVNGSNGINPSQQQPGGPGFQQPSPAQFQQH